MVYWSLPHHHDWSTTMADITLSNGTTVTFEDNCPLINDWPTQSTFRTRTWTDSDRGWVDNTVNMSASGDLADLLPTNVGSGKWRTMVSNIVRDAMDEGWIVDVLLHSDPSRVFGGGNTLTVTLRSTGEVLVQGLVVATTEGDNLPTDDRRASIKFSWTDEEERGRMLFDRTDCHTQQVALRNGTDVRLFTRRLGSYKGNQQEAGWKDVQPLTLASAPPAVAQRLAERVAASAEVAEAAAEYDRDRGLRPALRAALEGRIVTLDGKATEVAAALRSLARGVEDDGFLPRNQPDVRRTVKALRAEQNTIRQILAAEGTTTGDGGDRRFLGLEEAVMAFATSASTDAHTVKSLLTILTNVNADLQVVL